ncbi:hypothetical protein ACWV95_18165 [Streptomyces albus]
MAPPPHPPPTAGPQGVPAAPRRARRGPPACTSTPPTPPTDPHGATDAAAPVEWVIDLTAPAQDATEGPAHGLSWHRGHAKADVALRGPLTDLLLVLQRRLPSHSPRVEVLGDRTLLDLWLRATSFD